MKLGTMVAAVAVTVAAASGVVIASNQEKIQPLTDVPPIDGSNHNRRDPHANQAGTAEKRFLPDTFLDHLGGDSTQFPGQDRPGPREISNAVFAQDQDPVINPLDTNNFLWQFGQFLDHDFGITVDGNSITGAPDEPFNIAVPTNDQYFDSLDRPFLIIQRQRHAGGTAPGPNPRMSINNQTGWIDASQVYGFGQTLPGPNPAGPTPDVIREHSGGRLLLEPGTNLLPRVPTVLPTENQKFPPTLFVCGDHFPRCNETPGLTMIHTLFVREHNRKVAEYAAQNPNLNDEQLFQLGRRWVASLIQSITVNEFIPALTGKKVAPYTGHNPRVNGRLAMEFEQSLYRLGHTLLPRTLKRFGKPDGQDPLPDFDLGETLFQAADLYKSSEDVDAVIRGFLRQPHEKVDCVVSNGVRNTLLVDEPGEFGTLFDLPAINIARGRELGLPSYNQARRGFGLPPVRNWSDAFDAKAAARLSSVYANPDQVDLFAGGICERAAFPTKGHTGPLITAVVHRQIEDLRAADRFWYQNILNQREIREVEQYTLAHVILNNSGLKPSEINLGNAFKVVH